MVMAYGLMYHDVVSDDDPASGFVGLGSDRYRLTWHSFKEHLECIAAQVDTPPGVSGEGPAAASSPAWMITFDDGGASALAVGEELVRRRWPGHFFVTTGCIGTPGFLDANGIRELDAMGHVVGSHSVTHPSRMSQLSPPELQQEWKRSVETLAEILGKDVETGSVPGGSFSKAVAAAAARAGIARLFTSEPVRTPRRVEGCLCIGRFVIRADTAPDEVARAAAGISSPWFRQFVGWNARKPAKAVAGDRYARLRRAALTLRSAPRSRR